VACVDFYNTAEAAGKEGAVHIMRNNFICCAMQWEGVPMFISSKQAYRPGTSSGLRWKDIEPILGLLYSVVGAHHDPAIVREGQERAGKEPPIISL
jgi:hypothetical protein